MFGRGEVDGDVVRHRVGFFETGEVVVGRVLVGRVLVFPDVESDWAGEGFVSADVFHSRIDAWVVEAHSVDDGLVGDQAEQAWLWISLLRAWGDCTDFDETEAESPERIDGVAFLVETGGEADAVGKFQAHDLYWPGSEKRWGNALQQSGFLCDPKPGHADVVGLLGIH